MVRPETLKARARVLRGIRNHLDQAGYLEVETPVRVPVPAMELHIDAIASEDAWLRTSPELHMKRLLAAGLERIYQIGPCFRQGERGARHNPEFTMLEWYEAGGDYRTVLDTTQALLRDLGYDGPWEVITVRESFLAHAGWDPVADFDADRFDLDLVERVEPALPRDRAVVLIDYPAPLAALARTRGAVAERWEMYLHGVELANAYSELTDPAEQRARFEAWGRARAARKATVYPLDEEFLSSLADMPAAGGIAIGVDRLVMGLTGAGHLAEVRAFVEE